MKTTLERENEGKRTVVSVSRGDHPVKGSAFLCIIEVVTQEHYEELPAIIRIAREFGARRWDIQAVLVRAVEELQRRKIKRRCDYEI